MYMMINFLMLPSVRGLPSFHLGVMSGTVQPVVSYGREHRPTRMDMILETLQLLRFWPVFLMMAVLEGNENEIHVHEAVDSEMHVSDFQH
jgi:hypothetical protein